MMGTPPPPPPQKKKKQDKSEPPPLHPTPGDPCPTPSSPGLIWLLAPVPVALEVEVQVQNAPVVQEKCLESRVHGLVFRV
jgi:hypothetical protein